MGDNCVVGSFCVLTFKVRELLTFVFWCLLICSQTGGNPPLSGYVRFGETQLPVVSRTSSFGLDGSSFFFELVLYNSREICECI